MLREREREREKEYHINMLNLSISFLNVHFPLKTKPLHSEKSHLITHMKFILVPIGMGSCSKCVERERERERER